MENKKEKLIRCTECSKEQQGNSIEDILSEMRCGKTGGELTDSCRACLKSDSKYLFKVVPNETPKDNKRRNSED